MKTAIVGCGKISHYHIQALQALGSVDICGLCDKSIYQARHVAERVGSAGAYDDFAELLANERPDVVHVLTPPNTHAELTIQAARAKCHVFVEKPMALNTQEASAMLAAAQEHGVRLCVNHNYLFKPSIARARKLIADGEIGAVVFVNSYYGLSGEGGAYAGEGGHTHWALQLPGGAFTNFLPHLIYLQMAFLRHITAVEGVTTLQPDGAGHRPTELTALLQGEDASGVMVVSMRAKPYAKYVDIYGTRGIIHADLVREVCTLNKDVRLPRMLSKAVFNIESSVQLTSGTVTNTTKVLLGKLPNMPGMHVLIRDFYASLATDQPPPVSGEDGKRTIEIMEAIWNAAPALTAEPRSEPVLEVDRSPQTAVERKIAAEKSLAGRRVLVTGATGFLGHHAVAALARCGAQPVALVRDENRVAPKLKQEALLAAGDLRDVEAVKAALQGVDTVFHCAAITTNKTTWREHEDVNIKGTENLLAAALEAGVRRVIHISSVIVYGLDEPRDHTALDESAPYPAHLDQWAYYMRSKIAAEQRALQFQAKGLPVTILRLGILYGPGGGRLPGKGLMQLGRLNLVIGSGRNRLPFTYVGNAVDCMLLAAVAERAPGEIYNVVDEPQRSVIDIVRSRKAVTGEQMTIVPVPPFLLYSVAGFFERRSEAKDAQTPPSISRYVIRSAHRGIRYATDKVRQQLNWEPEVTLTEGLRKTTTLS